MLKSTSYEERSLTPLEVIAYFIISLLASVAGAICGIGGGVIIKPTLDLFHLDSVSTISFLSGCTVLAMSCYSVGKSMIARDSKVNLRTGTPLALGAAVGGIVGKQMFTAVKAMFADPNTVGAVQAAALAVITLGTLLYTIFKARIPTHKVKNLTACVVIGLALGIMSSFLGIGGGPINLVVLFFFFSMDTKTAAQNSLYIILFSQITSVGATIVTNTVPEFAWYKLVLMVAGGILGGILGRACNRRMDNKAVDKLFMGLMAVIIAISIYNTWQFL